MKIIFFLVLLFVFAKSSDYVRHLHNVSSGSRCLDGSPGGFYIHQGAHKDRIMLFFLGGGYCEGNTLSQILNSCHTRANTIYGSSKNYPPTLNMDASGVLSTKQQANPLFWNWTKVIVPYCDGSLHQGYKQAPINFKNKDLYFRGVNNTLQHFKWLNDTYGLYSANSVVVTGQSAGGIATFWWTDYIYERSTTKNVYSIPDSGLFLLDIPNPKTGKPVLSPQLQTLFELVNAQTPIPWTDCYKNTHDAYSCLNFSRYLEYFKAPIFMIESAYDAFSLQFIIVQKCPTKGPHGSFSLDKCNATVMKDITSYRNETLKSIANFTSKYDQFGAWVPACVQHGFSHEEEAWNGGSYKVPGSVGITLVEAVSRFLDNPKNKSMNIHIDSVQWPQNQGCSAHKNSKLNIRTVTQRFFDLASKLESS